MTFSASMALRKSGQLYGAGKKTKALKTLSEEMEKGSQDPRLAIRRGVLAGSIKDFDACLEQHPSNATALLFAGIEAFKNGDLDSANRHIATACDIAPKNLSAMAMAALIKLCHDNDFSALNDMRMYLSGSTIAVQSMALMEIEAKILKIDPDDTGAREKEDVLGGVLGRVFDAIDNVAVRIYWLVSLAMNQVVNIANSKRRKIKRNVLEGIKLDGLDKPDEAAKCFEKVLTLTPDDQNALEYLVMYNIERDNHGKADRYLSLLLRVLGDQAGRDPYLGRWRADILFIQKKYKEAMGSYLEVMNEFRLDYMIPYRTALCALRLNRKDRTREYFASALSRINPGLLAERLEKLSVKTRT